MACRGGRHGRGPPMLDLLDVSSLGAETDVNGVAARERAVDGLAVGHRAGHVLEALPEAVTRPCDIAHEQAHRISFLAQASRDRAAEQPRGSDYENLPSG